MEENAQPTNINPQPEIQADKPQETPPPPTPQAPKKKLSILPIVLFITTVIGLSAAAYFGYVNYGLRHQPSKVPSSKTGLANPASVYCSQQGGTLEMRENSQGQYGVCMFDDGSECEEWAFYKGECQPGDNNNLSPTPDVIANWKKYSSSTYQIKYPKDIIFKEDAESTVNLSYWGPTQTEGTELFDGFSVNFQPLEISNTTLNSYVQTRIEDIKKQGVSQVISGPESIVLNLYQGFTYTEEGLGTFKNIIIESTDKKMFMSISILVSDPTNQGFSDIVDQILSTFKFTSDQSTKPIAEIYCIDNGGKWLKEFGECENISKDACTANNGVWKGCESACRHEQSNLNCIGVCVQVCYFQNY